MKGSKLFKAGISVLLATSLMTVPVMADNTLTFSTDGDATIPVVATIPSAYEVSIPASLALAYNETSTKYEGSYTVGAKGSIGNDEVVYIRPSSNTVSMSGVINTEVINGTLTQSNKTWGAHGDSTISKTTYTNKTGAVSIALPDTSDVYTGKMKFTFGTEFASPGIGTEYKGAEVLNLIKKYSGKSNFSIVVDTVEYIGSGGVKFDTAGNDELIANASDPDHANYINPLATYEISDVTTDGDIATVVEFTTSP